MSRSGKAMDETSYWYLHPIDHPLCASVLERGMVEGKRFACEKGQTKHLNPTHHNLQTMWPNSIIEINANTPIEKYVFFDEIPHDSPFIEPENILIISTQHHITPYPVLQIHDALLPSSSCDAFRQLQQRLFEPTDFAQPDDRLGGYFVAIEDLTEMILRIIKFNIPIQQSFHVSGRRYWEWQTLIDEFLMLYRRTVAGRTGEFKHQHLAIQTLDHVSVKPIEQITNHPQRINLAPFHDLLKHHTGEGWRPITPMRVSLMSLIQYMLLEGLLEE